MMLSVDKNLTGDSEKWKNWVSALTLTTCKTCAQNHGRIFPKEMIVYSIPVHINCMCKIEDLRTINAGYATYRGFSGADVFLFYFKETS